MATESVKLAPLPPPATAERGRAAFVRPPVEKVEPAKSNSEEELKTSTGTLRVPPDPENDNSGKADKLAQAVHDINEYVQSTRRNLEFDIDDSSGRTIIRVMDADSEELVRQIPAEEVLAVARRLRDASNEQREGLIFQERV